MNQKKIYSYPQLRFQVKPEMKKKVESLAAQHGVTLSAYVRAAIYQLSEMKNYHERNKLVHGYIGGPGSRSEVELETPEEKAKREKRRAARRKAIGTKA